MCPLTQRLLRQRTDTLTKWRTNKKLEETDQMSKVSQLLKILKFTRMVLWPMPHATDIGTPVTQASLTTTCHPDRLSVHLLPVMHSDVSVTSPMTTPIGFLLLDDGISNTRVDLQGRVRMRACACASGLVCPSRNWQKAGDGSTHPYVTVNKREERSRS